MQHQAAGRRHGLHLESMTALYLETLAG